MAEYGTDIGAAARTDIGENLGSMSGEVVRRRRKKGGKRRREDEEREEKEEQREEGEEEPILVTDAAAREDMAGGTHSTLVKSLFLAGILGRQSFLFVTIYHTLSYLGHSSHVLFNDQYAVELGWVVEGRREALVWSSWAAATT